MWSSTAGPPPCRLRAPVVAGCEIGHQWTHGADGWAVRKRAVSGPIAYNQTRFPSGIAALADYVHGKGAARRSGVPQTPQPRARPRRLRPRARPPRPEAGPLHRLRHADLRKVQWQPGHRGRGRRAAGRLGRRPAQARQLLQRAGEGGGARRAARPAGRRPAARRPAAREAGRGWGAQRTVQARYADMGKALNATGRPIVYSMCEWGVSSPWMYGREVRWPPGAPRARGSAACRPAPGWPTPARGAAPGRPHVAYRQGHQHRRGGELGRRDAGAHGGRTRWPATARALIAHGRPARAQNLDDTTGLSRFAGPGGRAPLSVCALAVITRSMRHSASDPPPRAQVERRRHAGGAAAGRGPGPAPARAALPGRPRMQASP